MQMLLSMMGLALITAASGHALDDEKTLPPGIAWQHDWKAALQTAARENKPLMVAFVIKGETANEQVMKQHFKHPDVIAESRKFVCVVACRHLKDDVEGVRTDGTVGAVNKKLGGASSRELTKVEQSARTTVIGGGMVSCPQFVFFMPDGKTMLLRHVWMLPVSGLLEKMRLALGYFDPKQAPPGFRDMRDRVTKLLEAAAHNNVKTRRPALQTLAGVDDPRAYGFFQKQTGPTVDTQKRLETVFYFGTPDNAKVLPRLHDLLGAKDSQTRIYAAVALHNVKMQESVPHLAKALKKEKKDRARAHILRALVNCEPDEKETEQIILKSLKSRSTTEKITALFIVENTELTPKLEKALLSATKDSNKLVRAAAYCAIGSMGFVKAKPLLEKRKKSERGEVKEAVLWALDQLGGDEYETEDELDPLEKVRDELPDKHLYEGEFEDSSGRPRRRRGGGGRR